MTKRMTEAQLAAIEARAAAATPGPWTGDPDPYAIYIYGADRSPVADTNVPGKHGDGGTAPDPEDGERGGVDAVLRLRGVGASQQRAPGSLENNYRFMIHARTDVPALAAEVRASWADRDDWMKRATDHALENIDLEKTITDLRAILRQHYICIHGAAEVLRVAVTPIYSSVILESLASLSISCISCSPWVKRQR